MSAESRRGCFWVVGFWRGQGHDGGGGGGGGGEQGDSGQWSKPAGLIISVVDNFYNYFHLRTVIFKRETS